MNYNTLRNKPTINHKELIGNNKASDIGGMTEEDMEQLLTTDLTPYYTKDQIDDLFSRSFVYREKSGSIVTFDCPSTSQSIPEVTAEIVAVQSGSGDPSPTNVRPISGWSAVNVYDGPTTDPLDATTYTIDLDGTRYGGTLDVVSGVLTVDRGILTLNGSEDYYAIQSSSANGNTVLRVATGQTCKKNEKQKSNYGTFDNYAWQNMDSRANTFVLGQEGNLYLQLTSSTASTVAEFKALFASNPLQAVYELDTPQTIQLTPTAVKSLLGTNNLWADTGDIEVKCLDRIIPAEE